MGEARKAGFTAIECHWPYDIPAADLRAALAEARLPLLGINTGVGDRARGDFGLSAVPGRETEARALIDQALDYALAAGGNSVHVMAGNAAGDEARETFLANLRYAHARLAQHELVLLIEPLNHRDAPGYYLRTLEQARSLVAAAQLPRLKIMFDCYHIQIEGGDLLSRFAASLDDIGHVQIAGVPSRAEPDAGEVAYERLLPAMVAAGYSGWFGAEYRPRGTTQEGLNWLKAYRGESTVVSGGHE